MSIYIYIYSLAQSQYVIKIDIGTQKEHIRLNVSAKAFISNNCSKSDGAYIKISKLQRTQNNSLNGSYLLHESRHRVDLLRHYFLFSHLLTSFGHKAIIRATEKCYKYNGFCREKFD